MSVEQQIQSFYNSLTSNYIQLLDEKIYKFQSVVNTWDELVLLSDVDTDLKPYLKTLGKVDNEYYFQYSINEGMKNTSTLKPFQYLNKNTSNITNIMQI